MKRYCTTVQDRDSQKPVVVRRGGAMIKRSGIAALEDWERCVGTPVLRALTVRVERLWGGEGGGRADSAARGLLRVLGAAAAGRLRAGSAGVGRGPGVSVRRTHVQSIHDWRRQGVRQRAARARGLAPRADCDASGEGSEV